MRNIKYFCLALSAVIVFTSCEKKDSFSLSFETTGYYFSWGGEPQTHTFGRANVNSVSLVNVTAGWSCVVNDNSFTITPPEDPGTEEKREELRTGSVTLSALSTKGNTQTYVLSLYIVGDHVINLNEAGAESYANCYVASTPMALYTFDGKVTGTGEPITPTSVKLLWQSTAGTIQHLNLSDSGMVSFYIDVYKENDKTVLVDGEQVVPNVNSVIAVLDSAGEILWSWHIWIIRDSENPLATFDTYSNGCSYMNKNLGAFVNSNASDDEEDILNSYGLYYQWGRKDPFPRPRFYNCTNNLDERLCDVRGTTVYVTYEATSATVGTVEYAVAHPTTFITNAACVADDGDGIGDWLATPNSNLWSNDSTVKGAYDPCPAGWRVPTAEELKVLSLSDEEDGKPLDEKRKQYGWTLSDGSASYFYTGAGYRSYYNGIISNMNHKDDVYPSIPEPWEGYYWSAGSTADGKQSYCLYFDLTTTRTINKFDNNYPSRRANAMQVRCVKM